MEASESHSWNAVFMLYYISARKMIVFKPSLDAMWRVVLYLHNITEAHSSTSERASAPLSVTRGHHLHSISNYKTIF